MAEDQPATLPEQGENVCRGARTATTSSNRDSSSNSSEQKSKDIWDKAQIVSGFVASVVIAAVGLMINSSIQRSQIQASEDATRAQLEITDRNNKAQLALTEKTAEIQRHIQESALTGQLVEFLAGNSALKKQVAIVALRRSVPPEMYQDVITIVVRADPDQEVRKIALQQAATIENVQPGVVRAITEAATTRSGEEQKIATEAIQDLGLRSINPQGTFILSSSSGDEMSFEAPQFGGGIFTHFLVEGLSGGARPLDDGSLRVGDLARYVSWKVREASNDKQHPSLYSMLLTDVKIVGPDTDLKNTLVITMGNSIYHDPHLSGLSASEDATKFYNFFNSKGASAYLIKDADRRDALTNLQQMLSKSNGRTTLIFYYSGHSYVDSTGNFWLLPVDVDMDHVTETAISTIEINHLLRSAAAQTKVIFMDTSFAGKLLGAER
jgi:hypothetical protein